MATLTREQIIAEWKRLFPDRTVSEEDIQNVQKYGVGLIGETYQKLTGNTDPSPLQGIYNSNEFQLLSPEQQKAVKLIVDSYEAQEIGNLKLDDATLKVISDKAAEIINPDYQNKTKRIWEDFETSLSNDLFTANTELNRAKQDLKKSIKENDAFHTEQLKIYIRNLQDVIPELRKDRDMYVGRKREYLETQLERTKQDLSEGLGRVKEDKLIALRDQERRYTEDLRQFRKEVVRQGYTWSSDRATVEKYKGEENQAVISATKLSAKRKSSDLNKEASRYRQDIKLSTAEDINDIMTKYGRDIRTQLQRGEQAIGTKAIKDLGLGGDKKLVGGVEGDVQRNWRQTENSAVLGYQRGIRDVINPLVSRYGTDAIADHTERRKVSPYDTSGKSYLHTWGSNIGNLTNIGENKRKVKGVDPRQYGYDVYGTLRTATEREEKDLEQERLGQVRALRDLMITGYQESKLI